MAETRVFIRGDFDVILLGVFRWSVKVGLSSLSSVLFVAPFAMNTLASGGRRSLCFNPTLFHAWIVWPPL